jgi:small conductance mechanosensitive channel
MQIKEVVSSSTSFINAIKNIAIDYAPKLVGAIVVYFIGTYVIKWISNLLTKIFHSKQIDPSLQSFLYSLVRGLLTILLLLTVFGMLGVNLTSFAAILAGLAVGIGSALNGTLGNFAGGVMILLFKPFKIGDLIEAQSQLGTVTELGIFNTILLSPENKTIILANGALSTGTIINYTTHGNLRVDTIMAIDQAENIEMAKKVALDALKALPKVLTTPAPEVNVLKVGDGMTTLAIRPYCAQSDYWEVYFGSQEAVKNAFDANGIGAVAPQRIIIEKNTEI